MYLNEVVMAEIPKVDIPGYFDFANWGTLNSLGVEWVNAHAPSGASVALADDVRNPRLYGLREDLKVVHDVDDADYAIVGWWRHDSLDHFHSPPLYDLRRCGMDLICVYAKEMRK
jgi:hypothetical protein